MVEENFCGTIDTPIGLIEVVACAKGIKSVAFKETELRQTKPGPFVEEALIQLREFFAGNREQFSLPLVPDGTAFESHVWNALQTIPFGQTCSYLDIANRLNNPGAIRAIGRANGANPIAVIIPCHRVIGSDGSLTGYAGGLWRKRWLLDHEARTAGTVLF
jgi:methylated-DNA-[protein]-cysteine S-methyltransferase